MEVDSKSGTSELKHISVGDSDTRSQVNTSSKKNGIELVDQEDSLS